MIDAIWCVLMYYFDQIKSSKVDLPLFIIENIDYSYTPGYTLAMDILKKNSIGHLLRTSREYFRPPPPKVLEKKRTIFMYIFEEYLLNLSYF